MEEDEAKARSHRALPASLRGLDGFLSASYMRAPLKAFSRIRQDVICVSRIAVVAETGLSKANKEQGSLLGGYCSDPGERILAQTGQRVRGGHGDGEKQTESGLMIRCLDGQVSGWMGR